MKIVSLIFSGLKFLFSPIVEVIKKHWKILLPILFVVGLIYFAVTWHQNQVKNAAINGYNKAVVEYTKRQEQEDLDNRQFEVRLQSVINEYEARLQQERFERQKLYDSKQKEIVTIIRSDPKYEICQVDPEITIRRNAIRENGPQ